MNVLWSSTALAHLTEIYRYIARDSSRYALRMVDRLTYRSKQLKQFPESGEIVPEYGDTSIREVAEGPYRIEASRIVVLSVIHGAQLLPLEHPS